jgi:hypothetical protein
VLRALNGLADVEALCLTGVSPSVKQQGRFLSSLEISKHLRMAMV